MHKYNRADSRLRQFAAGNVCVRTKAHMRGDGMGTLTFYKQYAGGSREEIMKRHDHQGDDWFSMAEIVPDDDRAYQVSGLVLGLEAKPF